MCQDVRRVTRGDDALHYVGQCEHGTVFLVWCSCTWSLEMQVFLQLSAFVSWAEGQPRADLERGVCSGPFALSRASGVTRLWVGEAGLALGRSDFECLHALLENAAWTLTRPGFAPADETLPVRRKQQLN